MAEKVRIIPSKMTTIATAIRGHINTTLAYTKLGMYESAHLETDCIQDMVSLLIYEIEKREKENDNG